MEGGNGASAASGITHSPTGEQTAARHAYQTDEAENYSGSRTKSATEIFYHKEHKEHKETIEGRFAVEPPKVLRTWKAASSRWFADVSSAAVSLFLRSPLNRSASDCLIKIGESQIKL